MHTRLTPPTMKERNVVFLQDFLSYFLSDSSKPFQRSPSYYPDPGTKHDTHDNGDFSIHNLSKLKLQPEPAYYLIQTQPIHEWLHENLHQKNASWDTLAISKTDFRHDHCKVDGSQNIHHQEFWSHLANHETLVAERWHMTDLGYWTILLAQTLVSH